MDLLTIKIEKNYLQLAEISHSKKKTFINKVRVFSIPENLENVGFVRNIGAFTDFVVSCIERGKLTKGNAILLLDVSSVLLKEYYHEKSKPAHLLALAGLEADAVLPDDEGKFIIQNEWYGARLNQDRLQTSSIYAVNEGFVSGITKEMKNRGIKLVAVLPTTIVHTDIIKKLISKKISGSEFDNKTVIAINMSNQEVRAAVFHNRELIHQRADDQIMEEFYRNVANAFSLSIEEAEEYCLKNGFDESRESNRENPEAYERMAESGVSLITRFARSIKIILSAENLRPDHIIISGSAAAIPGLTKFIYDCVGIQCNSIDDYRDAMTGVIDLGGELKDRKYLFERFVLLAGLDFKRKKELNFLTQGIARKKNKRRTIFLCLFLFITMLLVMSIAPINYLITSQDHKRNSQILGSTEYIEVQELLMEQRQVQAQINALEAETKKLPFGESNLAYLLLELNTKLFPGTQINSMLYDNETKTFDVVFTTTNLDSFVLAKNKVNEDEKFEVSLPLTISSEGDSLQCRINVKVLTVEEEQEGTE